MANFTWRIICAIKELAWGLFMSYQRSYLGQDEDVVWSNIDWNIPGGGAGAVYQPPSIDWGTVDWTKSEGVQIPGTGGASIYGGSLPAAKAGDSSIWGDITKALVPLSAAAANIIRATTGVTPPPGSMYDPKTGQYITPAQIQAQQSILGTNWLLPALLLGGGAILLLRRKR